MKIIYLGPSPEVNIGGYEPHRQGAIRDYPDAIGEDLLRSKKQRFEVAEPAKDAPPADMADTVIAVKKGKR